jgi:hypothetical protein
MPASRTYFDITYYENKTRKSFKIYHSENIFPPSILHNLLNPYMINDLIDIINEYIYTIIMDYGALRESDRKLLPNNKTKSDILRFLVHDVAEFKILKGSFKLNSEKYHKIVSGVEYIVEKSYSKRSIKCEFSLNTRKDYDKLRSLQIRMYM